MAGVMFGRLQPAGQPEDYVTYRLAAPLRTHWRRAGCVEYECPEYVRGFAVVVPADSAQADYVRADRTRGHRETRTEDGLARFEFPAGTLPYTGGSHDNHWVPVGREPLYVVRSGDWRRSTPLRTHSGADAWVDDFRSHTERLMKERE